MSLPLEIITKILGNFMKSIIVHKPIESITLHTITSNTDDKTFSKR